MEEPLFSAVQIGKMIGVSTPTVYSRIKKLGLKPDFRIGDRSYYKQETVDRLADFQTALPERRRPPPTGTTRTYKSAKDGSVRIPIWHVLGTENITARFEDGRIVLEAAPND